MSIKHFFLLFVTLFMTMFSSLSIAKTIVVYGDSLSAAYGLDLEDGWVALLDKQLDHEYGTDINIVNASISGETSAGGKVRLAKTLQEFKPDIVLLELGANDGLRGQSLQHTEANLRAMAKQINASGATLVVFGMTLPPSYGPRYIDSFRAIFERVALNAKAHYYDFVIEELIGDDKYVQADGLHPTAVAQPIIMQRVQKFLIDKKLLSDS